MTTTGVRPTLPETPGAAVAGDTTPLLSVVVPCRNEEETVALVVAELRAAIERDGYTAEIIVCDNASDDDSAARAAAAGAIVVSQPIRGYGAACLRGIEAARGELVVLVDGDGTYDVATLNRFVEPLRAGYEMVLGTRRNGTMLPGAMGGRHRHVLEPLQAHLFRRAFGLRVSDVRCGMRSIRRDALPRLNLGAVGVEFASEMVMEAGRAGLRMVEVPVVFSPRAEGAARRSVGDGWRVIQRLILLSPTRLFLLPGIALLLAGLGLETALLFGPVRFGRLTLDFHFMFVGGTIAMLGTQLLLLGLFAKTYALVHRVGTFDPWIVRFHRAYTLERGVAFGLLLLGAGLALNVWILSSWLSQGGGVLFAVRPAVLALTLMVIGAEGVFGSFFLSLLRASEFERV
ncbi:MAG TPA: glycosyltransferase family 2 protein [Longimicrobiales bacterium]|nr:glycosyltransferase family 2 protein [Longimicrobiales bacterium]